MTADELNEPARNFLGRYRSAHSDLVIELEKAIEPLGAARVLGNLARYDSPLIVADNGVAFACANGTSHVHFRLPPGLLERAIRTGANPSPISADWVCFTLFQADWPKVDLQFWARKAYEAARSLV